jgi:hypothetical protein
MRALASTFALLAALAASATAHAQLAPVVLPIRVIAAASVDRTALDRQLALANTLFAEHGVAFDTFEWSLPGPTGHGWPGHVLAPAPFANPRERLAIELIVHTSGALRMRHREDACPGFAVSPRGAYQAGEQEAVYLAEDAPDIGLTHGLGHYFGLLDDDAEGNPMHTWPSAGPWRWEPFQADRIQRTLRMFLARGWPAP